MKIDPIRLNRQTYNQITTEFAARTAEMPPAVAEQAARLAAHLLPGQKLLDLGCGTGRDLAWFAAHGVQDSGADLSRGMLLEARRVTCASLCQMDMRTLGFASRSFAAVWCDAALLHLPKHFVPQALAEIARVLIPGGRFFFSLQQGRGEGVETGGPANNIQRYFARYDEDEMATLLAQAGFTLLGVTHNQDDRRSRLTWLWFEAALTVRA